MLLIMIKGLSDSLNLLDDWSWNNSMVEALFPELNLVLDKTKDGVTAFTTENPSTTENVSGSNWYFLTFLIRSSLVKFPAL